MTQFLILLCLVGLPTLYGIRVLRKQQFARRKQWSLMKAYDRLVKQHKLSIEHSEVLTDRVIALDRKHKKLLLIDYGSERELQICIPLEDIAASKIVEERDAEENFIHKIVLELKVKRNPSSFRFCFYDDATDSITELPSLTRLAKNWKTRLEVYSASGSLHPELEYVL